MPTKRFLHQYELTSLGWIPLHQGALILTVHLNVPNVTVEMVTVQYKGRKDYKRCFDDGPGEHSVDSTVTRYKCEVSGLREAETLLLEAHFILRNMNSSLLFGTDPPQTAHIQSSAAAVFPGTAENPAVSCESILAPHRPTLGHQILQSWDLILGIAVGLILLILTGLLLQRLGVFGRVRMYRAQLEAMAITRIHPPASAFTYEAEEDDDDQYEDQEDLENENADENIDKENGPRRSSALHRISVSEFGMSETQ